MVIKRGLIFISFLQLCFFSTISGQLITPRVSPGAEISQTIGISKVTIKYSRPLVNGRQIWGKLVPYGFQKQPDGTEIPWRAGANENTIITFSDDVKVEDKHLVAGSYGIHMIASPKEWTIIFSKNFTSWGSFSYNPTEDALRINVEPYETQFVERLTYNFEKISSTSAIVYLHWEKLKIPFRIEFDVTSVVIESYRKQLRGQQRFLWESWKDAAFYCLQHNLNLNEAEKWIKKSILINENMENRSLLGYVLKARNKINEAIKVFEENVTKYPDDWNAYENLGEAMAEIGKTDEAIKNYEKAFGFAPDTQKPRIGDILNNLKSN